MTSKPGTADYRNAGIDLLRGIAIVLVIFNHVGIRIPLTKSALADWLPKTFLRDLNYNGYEAVFIFFVISGFLITRRAFEHWGSLGAISLREFYVRRGARILPALVALIAVLSALHFAGAASYVISKPQQSLGGAIAAALGLYINWYEGLTGYLPGSWDVLWSLSIEEIFYLCFPLLCLLGGSRRWFVVLLALLALSMPFTHAAAAGNEIWQEKAYLPGMGAIAIGVLAALVARRSSPSARVALALRSAGALGIVAILFAGPLVWRLLRDGYLLMLSGAAASLVLGLHWQPADSRGLPGLGWLRSCGRLSYEIYLTHMFCVFAIVDLSRWSGLGDAWGALWYAPAVIVSWLLGAATARGFTQPCERWLRGRLIAPPRAAPIVAARADV